LNEYWKTVFRERVIIFARSKWFVAQKGFEINNQVKAIISASAIQLTLGLKNWGIGYFGTILLFSTDFKNEVSGLRLKGETNLNGFVSFSWKSFIEGYRIPNDNLNLGLHEFTHALRFNGVRGHETDEFFNGYFPKWFSYARVEFSKLKKGGNSIFRKYGGANINEFLSVVVEHFFESPEEFKTNLPLFYSATAVLLNQQTDKTTTRIGVLKQELIEQEKYYTPLNPVSFVNRPPLVPSIICLSIAIFSAIGAGAFSFPSLFMFLVSAGAFLRSDYHYSHFELTDNKLILTKGFLIFKNRLKIKIGQAQITKTEFLSNENDLETILLVFFSQEGEFFEEDAFVDASAISAFKKELKESYVWVN
jgi:MtfA peptidase